MVGHDLRAPLFSVNISLTLLLEGKKGPFSEPARRVLEVAKRSLERLVALVNELLELKKIEAGLTLRKEFMSMFEACLDAKESLSALAEQAGVTIRGPVGEAGLNADEARIIQVVTNLLSNAIRFSPRDSTVSIEISRNPQFAEVRITDQGPGVEPENIELIFETFRTASAVSRTKLKTTGLGLAIVKALIEAQGGSVGLTSKVGQGSTFWFRLPGVVEVDDLDS
jgi:signal transduction histidine kinase